MRKIINRVITLLIITVIISFSVIDAIAAKPTVSNIKQVSQTKVSFTVNATPSKPIEYSFYSKREADKVLDNPTSYKPKPIKTGKVSSAKTITCSVEFAGQYTIITSSTFSRKVERFPVYVTLLDTVFTKPFVWTKDKINDYTIGNLAAELTGSIVTLGITSKLEGALSVIVDLSASAAGDALNSNVACTDCINITTIPVQNWAWRFKFVPDKEHTGFTTYLQTCYVDPNAKALPWSEYEWQEYELGFTEIVG